MDGHDLVPILLLYGVQLWRHHLWHVSRSPQDPTKAGSYLRSDTGSFGSLQALPSWLQVFGQRQASGMYTLPTGRAALMNSREYTTRLSSY